MEIYKRIDKNGYRLTVEYCDDTLSFNPRDWDNLGTMVCAHSKYTLGDVQDNAEAIEEIAKDKDNIVLPLYLYAHGGMRMSTMPYICTWDSGQVGIIYVSKDDIRKEYKVKRITKKIKDNVLGALSSEVETYSHHLEGNIFSFTLEKIKACETCNCNTEEHIDSCGGFYGYDFINNGLFDYVEPYGFTKEDLL